MLLTPEEQQKGYVSLMNEVVDPKTSTVIRRYTNPAPATPILPSSSASNAPASAVPSYLAPASAKPTLGTVDETAIRDETRKRMQMQIDAINAEFTNLIARENVAGEDRSGQTRAISARSGLIGSDFGAAQATKTTQFNQQQVKALEDEKAARVGSVLANIENRASAEIQARKAEALGKYQRDFTEYEQMQEQARADLKTLATSGAKLEQLNPAQRAALFQQAGYDENFGELIYNAMKPKANQIDYKFEKLADGRGLFYGVDPTTGELKTKEVTMDIPDDMSLTIAPDGTPILFNKNTGEARIASGFGQGQFAKPEEQEALYGGLTKEQRSELQRVQSNVRQDPDIKDFIQVRDGYERVETGASRDDAQGDLALLFGYMKLLDPNSVVRETEFANAEQAQGTLQKFMNLPDKFIRGTRLTAEARKHFAEAAKDLYARKEQSYERAADFYGNQLDQFNIPREMGLRDFGTTFEKPDTSDISIEQLIGQIPEARAAVEQMREDIPGITDDEIREALGLTKVGSDTKQAPKETTVKKTGMRTDRHNNPTAFTTDIAKMAGLRLGVDYNVGDPFPNNPNLKTARLLGDPVATTIKVINKIGFYTQSGKPRWTYVNSIPQAKNWKSLSYKQKANVIKQMYAHEGGSALLNNFA